MHYLEAKGRVRRVIWFLAAGLFSVGLQAVHGQAQEPPKEVYNPPRPFSLEAGMERLRVSRRDGKQRFLFEHDASEPWRLRFSKTTTSVGSQTLRGDSNWLPAIYRKEPRKIGYKFRHPLNSKKFRVRIRAKNRKIYAAPVRSAKDRPRIRIFDQGQRRAPVGELSYLFDSPALVSGSLEGKTAQLVRVDQGTVFEKGILRYLFFPFPLAGAFEIRLDGEVIGRILMNYMEAAGQLQTFELDLPAEGEANREEALLLFLTFGFLQDFVR